ncbi:uncharacterized protein LOC105842361 [Bombyx mori]|uniref:Uncharacterized protein n=1 Tax=Bombyx mori TaxID=7091 RepID=A0A8R2DPJ5_BOMMO|nr:uncharacterized protein LOC105842361 [Bombyx mori]XP_021207032.1 uncharacterized protein LOC105842361 [Bombyx mori]XP_037868109.1 uncharacterized protein LOC105842361 [Bombyx mori]
MCSTMWFVCAIIFVVADIRTGALQQHGMKPQQCHQCTASNTTSCELHTDWTNIVCPNDRPHCGTIATGPRFASSLTCSATNNTSCSLVYSTGTTLELTCTCLEKFCNLPFAPKLQTELLNFSSKYNDSENLTETFFKRSIFANSTDLSLYKEITSELEEATELPMRNSSQHTTFSMTTTTLVIENVSKHPEVMPHPIALKQNPSVPSDDDEDESEGSGSYEEPRSRNHASSVPAAPSSFLPANESNAASLPKVSCSILLLVINMVL